MSFPFLGSGRGPAAFDVYVAFRSKEDAERAKRELGAWARSGKKARISSEGSVLYAHAELEAVAKIEEGLRATLDRIDARSPISFAVRMGRVRRCARDRKVLATAGTVLDVITHLVERHREPYASLDLKIDGSESIHGGLFEALVEGSVLGGFVQQALWQTTRLLSSEGEREVWSDLLLSRLPSLVGRHFGVDVAIQERLALTQGVSPVVVEMPEQYQSFVAELVAKKHQAQHAFRDHAVRSSSVDWTNVEQVRSTFALGESSREALIKGFSDTTQAHTTTLLALTHDQRVTLAGRQPMATLMCNAAVHLMSRGNFADALIIYDAALLGPIDSGAAANPLFAVQDDNNHLGIDVDRGRRYLEACLRHGTANPTVFLNGSFVAAEIGQLDEAVRLLGKAKANGIKINRYKNERLFVPLRDRADFSKLMK